MAVVWVTQMENAQCLASIFKIRYQQAPKILLYGTLEGSRFASNSR